MTAVAYLRKSRVTSDRHVSWEVQLSNVNELAARYGHEPEVLSDWNKSGRKGAEGRPGYAQLLEMIEAGDVDTLYSYSLSRLSRSLVEYARLAEVCMAKAIAIRLVKEGELRYDTPSGRLHVGILALFAQMEAELAQERARDTVAVRKARGDRIGREVFADSDSVLTAYRDAGSLAGAAKLLTVRGIPARSGARVWQPSSVLAIMERVAPDELPVRRERGVKKAAPFLFYRLLRCHCGRTMTGIRQLGGKQPGYVNYRCMSGRVDPLHGKQTISEAKLIGWMMAEAALLRIPDPDLQVAEDAAAQQEALRERRNRLGRAHLDGLIVGADYEEELATITAELAGLEAAGRVTRVGPISWDREPSAVNQALRALWNHVQLDEELRPAFADWTVAAWRAQRPAA